MKYDIIGKSLHTGARHCYGSFENIKDCTKYLNSLKMGSLGNAVKFRIVKVSFYTNK